MQGTGESSLPTQTFLLIHPALLTYPTSVSASCTLQYSNRNENLFHFPFLVATAESFLLQMRNTRLYYPKDRNTDISDGRRLHTTHNSYWNISYHKVTGQNTSAWSQFLKWAPILDHCVPFFSVPCVSSQILRVTIVGISSALFTAVRLQQGNQEQGNLRPSFPQR